MKRLTKKETYEIAERIWKDGKIHPYAEYVDAGADEQIKKIKQIR